ncbi:MAG: hypothetical protein KGL39_52685 [Patescibacteria group bacterium]|nr:hypothetical protein [Patescibacteria group bacterium]
MNPIPVSRYQPGGDIYQTLAAEYGTSVADTIAAAAATGDRTQLANALENAKGVAPATNTSTIDNFVSQLYNDPLSAPLEQANTVLTNTGATLAKSTGIQTVVVLALIGVGIYLFWPKISKAIRE